MAYRQATIEFTPRDGREDRYMDATLAHRLYKEGKLAIDLTNSEGKNRTYYIPEEGYESEVRKLCFDSRY